MRREEMDLVLDWAAAEGWNPGVADAEAFFATDPGGFLVGALDDEPVASISVVAYGEGFGFLGFYIVAPAHRGRGYGLALWRAGMARLGSRNVGLDGVVAQQANYARSGFRYAYGNQRFEGVGAVTTAGVAEPPGGLLPLSAVRFDHLFAYDAACFGVGREGFLRRWLAMPSARGMARVDGGRVSGYGMIRACRVGWKIGPLFADDEATAEHLFRALVAEAPGEPVFLDVPLPNAAAVALAERHAMRPVFETARMYTAGQPALPLEQIFGVTSFELG